MKAYSLLAMATLAFVSATPAAAVTTFASFTPSSSNPNIEFSGTSNGAGTVTSTAAPVTFRFLDASGTGVADFDAVLNLAATTSGGAVFGNLGIVPVSGGTLSLTSTSAVTYGGRTGTNLLTVTIGAGSQLTGNIGGTTANFGTSTPPYSVTFTSDFLDFSNSTERDVALAINGINPALTTDANGLAFFQGTVGGQFGADAFATNPNPAVPEPATWAMLMTGFGLTGVAVRGKRRRIRAVAA